MYNERVLDIIERHISEEGVRCRRSDAINILGGVYRLEDGNNYSAIINSKGAVEIFRNGFIIHRVWYF